MKIVVLIALPARLFGLSEHICFPTCVVSKCIPIRKWYNAHSIPNCYPRNKVLSAACMHSRRVPWTSKSQLVYSGGIHGLILSLFAVIQQVVCV
jgi:hypothetical protein